MAKLDEFMALLTGSFNNKEQYSSLQKAERNFPYAEHINTACNDKINNLPLDFPGKFMVEESIYEVNGKRHASSHLAFCILHQRQSPARTCGRLQAGSKEAGKTLGGKV